MKKICIIILFFILSTAVEAQFIKRIGVKAGGTSSSQKYEYTIDYSTWNDDPDCKTGLNIGIFGEFLNLPVISVIGEFNYVEKGSKRVIYLTDLQHPDGNGQTRTLKMGMDYLNLSLLCKARLESDICTPYVLLGPKFDYEINRSEAMEAGFPDNELNKFRFGFKAGIGTEIKLFGINFLAEAIYDKDLDNLYKTSRLKITSSAIDFRAGIFINL